MVILALLAQVISNLPNDASALESAISALESEITSQESSSIPWEHKLPRFTLIVAFGVAMEFWVIWRERRDEMHDWGRGVICWPPARPSLTKFIVEIVSVLLITGGIVGELWAGVKITSINGSLRIKSAELRSKSDQLLALVTQKAGNAETASQGAVNTAKVANDLSGKAQREASGAETLANAAGDKAQSVEKQADDITKKLAWRTVDQEQLEVLKRCFCPSRATKLFPFSGTKIGFSYLSGDPEGAEYADELSVALRNTLGLLGAEITEPSSIVVLTTGGHLTTGLTMQVKDPKSWFAGFLQRGLKQAGIDAPAELGKINTDIDLFVATKPRAGDAKNSAEIRKNIANLPACGN